LERNFFTLNRNELIFKHSLSSATSNKGSTPTRPLPCSVTWQKILESGIGIDPATANSKIQLAGWNEVALDYQSMKLALA